MKRFILFLVAFTLIGVSTPAFASNYHEAYSKQAFFVNNDDDMGNNMRPVANTTADEDDNDWGWVGLAGLLGLLGLRRRDDRNK
ncbi:WGxxGxxG family protein [Melghirimyces profundicolus]|uniref:WGxxGxxG family protein n=1 Tax=Melghirimyces profundicolus TaxID=1242148 RepID=UPI000D33E939|nr:WGxxGxxG family protein [Melghirimyces profundicolus]